jgi:hypothetical protein
LNTYIQPTFDNINEWIKAFVPERDLFFLPENELDSFEEYLSSVLVIPQEEFFEHSSYKQIQLANSYEYWGISKEVKFILVAPSEWVTKLPVNKKRELFHIQKEVERGLIYPISDFSIDTSALRENVIEVNGEDFLVIQKAMWEELSHNMKVDLIKDIAQQWENWTCYDYPTNAPLYLKKFANTFPSTSGSNCLSATLFAITHQEWLIVEWIHPKTFMHSLKNAKYNFVTHQDLRAGDVVIWENSEGLIQHASYCIGENLFFNKSGQTFFNPWKIVDLTELNKGWDRYNMKIFRKTT